MIAAPHLSFHTRTALIVLKNLKSFSQPVAGIAMISTLVKQNVFMIEKRDISRPSTKTNHTSAITDHVKTTGHNIKWDHFDILASGETVKSL